MGLYNITHELVRPNRSFLIFFPHNVQLDQGMLWACQILHIEAENTMILMHGHPFLTTQAPDLFV